MTARKAVTRSGRGVRGYSASLKMRKMIPWESTLERDAILILEFSHEVKNYSAQPQKFYFYEHDQQKFCYPDFRACRANKCITHIEVKPSAKLKCPILRARLAAIKKAHEQQDIDYQIWDETFIRQEPRLTNLKLLAYHLPGINDDLSDADDAFEKLIILPARTLAGVIAILKDERLAYQLLALGYLICDLDQPITMESVVYLRERDQ
ncbi:hypothetical protein [Methylophilus sp. TWE2]|uniref:hypothetical protein n=1 Tax=Methylophilus sp. TWE2 TaxID=1662285 RepID=UPI000AB3F762|nr:hypothetical protein [Methylophilus sp. TWE2]